MSKMSEPTRNEEYTTEQLVKDVDSFAERVDQLVRQVEIITKAVEQIEEQVKDLTNDPLPCIDCGDFVDRATHKKELGFCTPCQRYDFDGGIER